MPSTRAGQAASADKARHDLPARDELGQDAVAAEAADIEVPSDAGQSPLAAPVTTRVPASPFSAALDELAELQVRRKFYIGITKKQTNAAKALVRRYLGWHYDSDEGDREKLNAQAARVVAAALVGDNSETLDGALAADLFVVNAAIQPLRVARDSVEREMKRIVRTLPIFAWASEVRGFGELGLAVILAEAGDLAKYPKKGHLWKRLGLASHEGKAYSTWRREGGLTAEDWTAAGYSPRRRAEIYAVVSEAAVPPPVGERWHLSRDLYRRRAATATAHPDWTKGHSHADGLRIMTKFLIRDLWNQYRRAIATLPDRAEAVVPAGRRARCSVRKATQAVPAGTDINVRRSDGERH